MDINRGDIELYQLDLYGIDPKVDQRHDILDICLFLEYKMSDKIDMYFITYLIC